MIQWKEKNHSQPATALRPLSDSLTGIVSERFLLLGERSFGLQPCQLIVQQSPFASSVAPCTLKWSLPWPQGLQSGLAGFTGRAGAISSKSLF
jgi:hypothetical protein